MGDARRRYDFVRSPYRRNGRGAFVRRHRGWLIAGSIAIVLARGGLGTLFPAAVAHFASEGVLQPLARNQTWRDIGAAAGPIATGILLEFYSPQEMQLALAAIYAVFFIWLMMSPIWRGERP